jgi:diaminopimelate decarboxylase
MKHLSYRKNELYIDDVKALDIAEEMYTPFYVYSGAAIQGRIAEFKSAFEAIDPIIAYSTKALSNINILKIFLDTGFHAHIPSFGDFCKAKAAGFKPERIIVGGPAKTNEEMSKAVYAKPFLLQIGALFELEMLKEITEKKRAVQNIGLRLSLGPDHGEKPYWAEGPTGSKFGLSVGTFERALDIINQSPGLKLKSIGVYLGSRIPSTAPYVESANALVDLFLQAQAAGNKVEYINMGGGFGIDYEEGESFAIADLANEIIPILKEIDGKIIFEPGRFLVGDSGLLITQVLGVKTVGDLTYVYVDAGMNDLLRPSIYETYHEAVPLVIREGEEITADIAGPLYDPADVIGIARPMIKPRRGEFMAFLNVGAYSSSMASNYNGRRRAAEVLIETDDFRVIRNRENWEDLYKDDILD